MAFTAHRSTLACEIQGIFAPILPLLRPSSPLVPGKQDLIHGHGLYSRIALYAIGKNCLFENYSLQVLFQFEFRKLNAVLDKKILEEKISNPKPLLDAEYQKFYDSKKETLLKLKDGKELINFVTEQTSTHNKDIASSFLCWAGIYGMKTSNPEYKCDYLFFDYSEHANQISIKSFHNKTGKEIPW